MSKRRAAEFCYGVLKMVKNAVMGESLLTCP